MDERIDTDDMRNWGKTTLRGQREFKMCELLLKAANEIDRLRAELQCAHQRLGNLLAVIHRDGGHYQDRHGVEEAAKNAEAVVCDLRAERDRLKEDVSSVLSFINSNREYIFSTPRAILIKITNALQAVIERQEED